MRICIGVGSGGGSLGGSPHMRLPLLLKADRGASRLWFLVKKRRFS
jgi:hypothetical protein